MEDRDGDGNATTKLNQNQNLVSGTYEFHGGWAVDQANNRLSLQAEDFDASIELTGGTIPIIDSVMPTMTSVTPVTGTVNVGNIASVNYVADGTGSDLTQVYLSFRNEAAGKQFSVEDRDGDGNATTKLNHNQNLVSGTYEFQSGWAVDQANNRLSLNAEDFDASITLVVPDNLTDAQTDFEPPILDDFSFLPDIA